MAQPANASHCERIPWGNFTRNNSLTTWYKDRISCLFLTLIKLHSEKLLDVEVPFLNISFSLMYTWAQTHSHTQEYTHVCTQSHMPTHIYTQHIYAHIHACGITYKYVHTCIHRVSVLSMMLSVPSIYHRHYRQDRAFYTPQPILHHNAWNMYLLKTWKHKMQCCVYEVSSSHCKTQILYSAVISLFAWQQRLLVWYYLRQ